MLRPQATWHEERQLSAAGPAMHEVYRLCSLAVCRAPLPGPGGAAGGGCGEAGGYFGGYELVLQQDLHDGLYHDADETAQTLRLKVGRRWRG